MGSVRLKIGILAGIGVWLVAGARADGPESDLCPGVVKTAAAEHDPAAVLHALHDVHSLVYRMKHGEEIGRAEIVAKMEALLAIDPSHPIYGTTGRLDIYLGQDGKQYLLKSLPHEEVMVRFFKYLHEDPRRFAYLRHRALLFHGSNSTSLLAFTAYGKFSGALEPLGELEKSGRVPFYGEIIDGRDGINAEHLSTAVFTHPGLAGRYARSGGFHVAEAIERIRRDFRRFGGTESGVSIDDLPKVLSFMEKQTLGMNRFDRHLIEIEIKRIREYSKLNAVEKNLVEDPFPVLFGIRVDRPGVVSPALAIVPGEFLVKGGARREEIRVIYVPQDRIEQVRALLDAQPGHGIHVAPLSEFQLLQELGTSKDLILD